jgi:hypothetical protein
MQDNQELPPPVQMMHMLLGRWVSQAIGAAAKLGIADHLASGPKSASELAQLCKAHGPSIGRLLRALASLGVFTEQEEGRFANTPLSDTLRADVFGSARPFALMVNHEAHIKAWLGLDYSVETGHCGFEKIHGAKPWDWLARNPEFGRIFDDAMTSFSGMIGPAIVQAYDFSGIGTLVDVGGGHGMLLASIVANNPSVRGVLFDQPHVVDGAMTDLEKVGGDFFVEVPAADAYILKNVIHDWNDADAVRILRTIHEASKPGARLLLVEAVIKAGNEPDLGKIVDIEMLVLTSGGRERNAQEHAQILRDGGFELKRIIPTLAPVCILEAVRI